MSSEYARSEDKTTPVALMTGALTGSARDFPVAKAAKVPSY